MTGALLRCPRAACTLARERLVVGCSTATPKNCPSIDALRISSIRRRQRSPDIPNDRKQQPIGSLEKRPHRKRFRNEQKIWSIGVDYAARVETTSTAQQNKMEPVVLFEPQVCDKDLRRRMLERGAATLEVVAQRHVCRRRAGRPQCASDPDVWFDDQDRCTSPCGIERTSQAPGGRLTERVADHLTYLGPRRKAATL